MKFIIGSHRIDIEDDSIFVDHTRFATFETPIKKTNVKQCLDGDCLAIISDGNPAEIYRLSLDENGEIMSRTIPVSIPEGVESVDEFLVCPDIVAFETMKPGRLWFFNLSHEQKFELALKRGLNVRHIFLSDGLIMAKVLAGENRTRTVELGKMPDFAQVAAA